MKVILIILTLISVFSIESTSSTDLSGSWRIHIDSPKHGPMESPITISKLNDGWIGKSLETSLAPWENIPNLPDDVSFKHALFSFMLHPKDEIVVGELLTPWRIGSIRLEFTDSHLEGEISNSFFFSGSVRLQKDSNSEPYRNYSAIAKESINITEEYVFDPESLNQDTFEKFKLNLGMVARHSVGDIGFIVGHHLLVKSIPFSHYELRRTHASAQEMATFFDLYEVGQPAAFVDFHNDIAILTVKTMMGLDTVRYIDEAFDSIEKKKPNALIIDLRGNQGGAFAVTPLVQHIIDKPLDAGCFVTQQWATSKNHIPSQVDIENVTPWKSTSLIYFWDQLKSQPLLRMQFQPEEPNFGGPVYILINQQTASAAELAVDALSTSESVTLIGESTAGEMLSQCFFDLQDNYIIAVPIADYISFNQGRIEGAGLQPDMTIESDKAMELAKQLIREGKK